MRHEHPVPGSALASARLLDGCRHVFLDVGSNRGVHVRFLYEPSAYPLSKYVHRWRIFESHFGPKFPSDPTVCAVGFEPNPAHAERLRHLGMRLRALGKRAEWFLAAAGNASGGVTMWHRNADATDANSSEWGFSSSSSRNATKAEAVAVIDLAAFIASEIVGRSIPPPPAQLGASDVRPPSVVMKLDVEGSEIQVLERMRSRGVLCGEVDLITCELHSTAFEWPRPAEPNSTAPYDLAYKRYPRLIDAMRAGTKDSDEALPHLVRSIFWARANATSATHTSHESARGAPPVQQHAHTHHHKTAEDKCATHFLWADDESYRLVADVPRAEWEPLEPAPRVGALSAVTM